jgi:Glycosyl hydrolases family 16
MSTRAAALAIAALAFSSAISAGTALAAPDHAAKSTIVRAAATDRFRSLVMTVHDSARRDRVTIDIPGHKPIVRHTTRRHALRIKRTVPAGRALTFRVSGVKSRPRVTVTIRRTTASGARATSRPVRTKPTQKPTKPTTPTTAVPSTTTPTTTTSPTVGTVAPNLVPMPVGNLPGWNQVFADDFTGTSLGSNWGAYQGIPGSSPTALWEPSHAVVNNGLDLQTYQDSDYGNQLVTAGVGGGVDQTYGQYDVRFRIDQADGVKYAIMLWPNAAWPCGGEIDFGEDGGGGRQSTTLTVHYCNSSGGNAILPQHTISADFSQWQTLGIDWTPGSIVWTLNGQPEATITGAHVPSGPMFLAIQSETNTNCALSPGYTCIDPTTPPNVNMDIAWVAEYAMANNT